MATHSYPFSSLRLWASAVENPAFAEKILRLLKTVPGAFDEVWLGTLPCLPGLEKHRRMAERNAAFAAKLRRLGIGVSLQIPESLGHRGCGIGTYEACDWELMVGADGTTCAKVSCPRSPGFIAYERKMIALYVAAIKPDAVWIDDDLRLDNHGSVRYGCFCENCLAEFSRRQGKKWTREKLVKVLFGQAGSSPVRLAWTEFNQATLAELADGIAEAAAAVHPGVRAGLQNGTLCNMYNGTDHCRVYEAMAKATGRKAGVRPGAGAYTDYDPRELVAKAFVLGGAAMSARNSGHVDAVCAEIENYPRTALGKTSCGTVLEGALELALGCNSLSYVLNVHQDSSFEFDLSYYRRIAAWRPFFEKLSPPGADIRPGGLNMARSARHAANAEAENAFRAATDEAESLLFNGVPISWNGDDDQGKTPFLLTASAAEGFDREDFARVVLSGNVLMSGEAFLVLQRKSLTSSLGIAARRLDADAQCGEVFTNDLFNGGDAGAFYYLPQTHAPACVFDLAGSGAHSLGAARRHLQTEDFGCTSFLLKHHGNRRLAVCGLPAKFSREVSEAKHRQLLRLADWTAGGRLPVMAKSTHTQVLIPLLHADGRPYGVVVLNCSIEPDAVLELELRGLPLRRRQIAWSVPEKPTRRLPLRATDRPGVYRVELPAMPAWGIGLLS